MKRKQRKRKPRQKYRKRTQTAGFLNRHDFIYAGRDTVNQVGKIAPRIKKKNTTKEIKDLVQQSISQIICQGGKEVERELPKILGGATEDVCIRYFVG